MTEPFFTIEEKIKRCIQRHPDWPIRRIHNSTGGTYIAVKAIKEGLPIPAPASADPSNGDNPGATLVSFGKVVAKYDTRSAILRAIAELPDGKLISEHDLCQKTAGTDRNRFRRTVENCNKEFEPLRIKLRLEEGDPKWYWASASVIAAAKKVVDPWA